MADTPDVTRNLLEMYGRDDWVMRFNFRVFVHISGIGELPRNSKILDCGCAMGHLLLMLKSYGFSELTGIDASLEMVNAANQIANAPIIHSDVLELEKHVEPSSFDAVIVSDLIHHLRSVSQWEKLLSNCRHALKEGGMLVIREPHPTLALNILYKMSRYPAFHIGFLKSRLQSFIDEDEM
ncbi:MAG: class I SAM-dependent methyltransferase, partial [Nitrospinota bacterium]